MSLRDRIKRRLPILGAGGNQPARPAAAPSHPAPVERAEPPEPPASPRGDRPVAEFIDELVKGNPITIFMKGSPDAPMCGFSANAADILRSYGRPIAHFDVLLDPEVRQGVKEYAEWPTLPQIYVGGEFLGGSDILVELHRSGELRERIEAAFADGAAG